MALPRTACATAGSSANGALAKNITTAERSIKARVTGTMRT